MEKPQEIFNKTRQLSMVQGDSWRISQVEELPVGMMI
jgi:hypothetical protein